MRGLVKGIKHDEAMIIPGWKVKFAVLDVLHHAGSTREKPALRLANEVGEGGQYNDPKTLPEARAEIEATGARCLGAVWLKETTVSAMASPPGNAAR